ncbi:MAG: beta-ketoacyl-[acyl-carrier-protein] synthase II [Chloroflexota bacterium]|nr:MAG: beta-ketoacyl-[acyl-carrier-protein] synthase II [Chloroflexota bacterium]
MPRRVVITGVGMVTPLGNDVSSTWAGLIAGRSGIGPITRYDPARTDTKFAGEVKGFDPEQYVDRREARRMDRFAHFAIAAAKQARDQSGLEISSANADRIGAIVGTGIGGLETLAQQFGVLHERGPSRLSPFLSTMMLANMAAGQIGIQLGCQGPNFAAVSACASGAHAIGESFEMIRRGAADAMFAGGGEAPIVEIGVGNFNSMRALSTRNDDPTRASRPFDAERDGFVIAEGGGMLLLEEREHARARGATILAEIVGFGASADAHHVSSPPDSGDGAARAMRIALAQSGLALGEIGYLNAHATSTEVGDLAETNAIKSVFGDRAARLPISSTKSMTGHLLGATGAIEAIFCILAMREGVVPPTINQQTPDPACDLDYVPNVARRVRVDAALNNSFGFGGQNASVVLRRPD